MAKYEYQVTSNANADAETALNYKDAVKTAKRFAKENNADCFIDVSEESTGDLANFYYIVSPDGTVVKN